MVMRRAAAYRPLIEHFGQSLEGAQKDPNEDPHGDLSKYLHLKRTIRTRALGGSPP